MTAVIDSIEIDFSGGCLVNNWRNHSFTGIAAGYWQHNNVKIQKAVVAATGRANAIYRCKHWWIVMAK